MLRKPTFWVAFLVGVGAVRGLAGCGSPVLVQCRVDAVLGLPLEPDAITLGDLKDVQRKVKSCMATGDAGP